MAEAGAHSIAYAFPRVTMLTTGIDPKINELGYLQPGLGNFGDRYVSDD